MLHRGGAPRIDAHRLVTLMLAEDKLRKAIEITQAELRAGIGHAGIIDVAFIGNTSDTYIWEPAMIVDIDVCLFVESTDSRLGHWLLALRDRLQVAIAALGADFELKVVRGPYKPAAWRLSRPIVVAHIGVFTKESYQQATLAIRWSWKKYRCVVEPDRLFWAAQEPPHWRELRAMAERKLSRIRAERVQMAEWELPEFVERNRAFTPDHPVFAEYCLAGPLVCARIHGRILRYAEADQLSNRDFVRWYRREILDVAVLEELLDLKEVARQRGYEGLIPTVSELASRYFTALLQSIDASSWTLERERSSC